MEERPDIDSLLGPLVVAAPQEVATYLELTDADAVPSRRDLLLAKFYELSGEYELALQLCDSVIDTSTELDACAMACISKARLLYAHKPRTYPEIVNLLTRATETADSPFLWGHALICLGMHYTYEEKEIENAERFMTQSLNADLSSYSKGIVHQHLACWAQEKEQYAKAVQHYGLALQEVLSENGRAVILTNLGRIYHQVYENNKVAQDYFSKALTLFQKAKIDYDASAESLCVNGLAECREESA